ncbi:hypothetical protein [Aerosakkonema funiforme]|nr:hypothetical protein [Aerosakkonema funiforme]
MKASYVSLFFVFLWTVPFVLKDTTLAQNLDSVQPIYLTSFRGCRKTVGVSGAAWFRSQREISIGRRLYRTVANINSPQQLGRNKPLAVICKIAEPGEPPRFSQLQLSLGFNDEQRRTTGGSIRVSVYSNGNFKESKIIIFGTPTNWVVDIQGTEDLGLEFDCLNPTDGTYWGDKPSNICPTLYFLDDTIQ